MEVVAMLFTYPTNCHMLWFNTNRPLYGLPSKKGSKTSNERVQNAVLGCSLKNDRMISVHFQGKPFSITVIQGYAASTNAEEAEVEQF